MITKCFEVRDRGTFMPVMAIKLVPDNIADELLLRASGYRYEEHAAIIVVYLEKGTAANSPYEWKEGGARTLPTAHSYIEKHFDEMKSGDVIDCEFITGETTELKKSEITKHF